MKAITRIIYIPRISGGGVDTSPPKELPLIEHFKGNVPKEDCGKLFLNH